MSQLLAEGGHRAGTLRSRFRAIRNHPNWLSHHHHIGFPTSLAHFMDYLRARLSVPETCTRGALKNAHQAFKFLEDSAGIPASSWITNTTIYSVIKLELLAAVLPGAFPRQTPRMFVSMLAALEDPVLDPATPPYFRVYGWWILIQSWRTMGFRDHRGVQPKSVKTVTSTLSASLTQSKTIGSDWDLVARPIVIDVCCTLTGAPRVSTGWNPSPSTNYACCRKMEMRYETALTIQNRILSILQPSGARFFRVQVCQFWTPHSSTTFMPSSTAALEVPK